MEKNKRLGAFEMWGYRKILKISWMDRITNKKVLERISEGKLLWKSIVRRRNEWIANIIRHEELLKLIIEGSVGGKNHRGKPKLEYIQI